MHQELAQYSAPLTAPRISSEPGITVRP